MASFFETTPGPTPSEDWYFLVFLSLKHLTQSGTTAQRPTENLWAGRPYFDTSLGANGKPIWYSVAAGIWVLADGTAA